MEVLTTSETYTWLFVTQIFHNGQPSRIGDSKAFAGMTYLRGTLGNVTSLLTATLYQGNLEPRAPEYRIN